eukprot:1628154-Amphidinium_carterae.1
MKCASHCVCCKGPRKVSRRLEPLDPPEWRCVVGVWSDECTAADGGFYARWGAALPSRSSQ